MGADFAADAVDGITGTEGLFTTVVVEELVAEHGDVYHGCELECCNIEKDAEVCDTGDGGIVDDGVGIIELLLQEAVFFYLN